MSKSSLFVPRLVIIEGPDKGKVIPLQEGTAIIGRSKGDIIIKDPRVSRSHVALHFDEQTGKLSFTDLRSLNGCAINGEPAFSGDLYDGDQFEVGDTVFDCQITIRDDEFENRPKIPKRNTRPTGPKDPIYQDSEYLAVRSHAQQQDREKTRAKVSGGFISRFQDRWLNLPRSKRVAVLSTMVMVLGVLYLWEPPTNQSADPMSEGMLTARRLQLENRYEEAIEKTRNLTAAYPNNPEVFHLLGDLFSDVQQYEPAIEAYNQSLQLNANPILNVKLVRVYLRSGLIDQASNQVQILGKAFKKGPRTKELFLEMGKLFVEFRELNPPQNMTYLIAKALQNEYAPQSPVGYQLEAYVLFARNRLQEALTVLQKGLALAPSDPSLSKAVTFANLRLEAAGLLKEQKIPEALNVLLKAEQIDPNDVRLLETMALVKYQLQDYDGTSAAVLRWLKFEPSSTRALLIMSYLKLNANDNPGAVPYLEKILAIGDKNPKDPFYPEALFLTAELYKTQQRLEVAQQLMGKSCGLGYQKACDNALSQKPRLPGSDGNKGTTTNPPTNNQNSPPPQNSNNKSLTNPSDAPPQTTN